MKEMRSGGMMYEMNEEENKLKFPYIPGFSNEHLKMTTH